MSFKLGGVNIASNLIVFANTAWSGSIIFILLVHVIFIIIWVVAFLLFRIFKSAEVIEENKWFRALLVTVWVRQREDLKNLAHNYDGRLGNPARLGDQNAVDKSCNSVKFKVIIVLDHSSDLLVNGWVFEGLTLPRIIESWSIHDIHAAKMFHSQVFCYRFDALRSNERRIFPELSVFISANQLSQGITSGAFSVSHLSEEDWLRFWSYFFSHFLVPLFLIRLLVLNGDW